MSCSNSRDLPTLVLSLCLCTGLIISYLPQHLRIINAKSSEGFSPWYLLLGSTSSASGMLNLLIVQWPLFQCCRVLPFGSCFESLLGFYQVALQWLLFSIILVLYFIYFPPHLKYTDIQTQTQDVKKRESTAQWRLSVTLGIAILLHLLLLLLLSLSLLLSLPTTLPPHPLLQSLALFLGLSATLLSILQYAPQIYKTYKSKLVGALSLGTMAIQTPGSVLFVMSLVFREGTDWTSWLAYAVTGVMQGVLLITCMAWRRRQARLGIDDFGNPLESPDETTALLQE